MRLLLDANLSPRVAVRLIAEGHDVVHVADVGKLAATDAEILRFAAEEERVVVSSDTDFGSLLARLELSQPSFVLFRHVNEMTPDDQARLLVEVLPRVVAELEAGAVVTLVRGRVRTRRLPFDRRPAIADAQRSRGLLVG